MSDDVLILSKSQVTTVRTAHKRIHIESKRDRQAYVCIRGHDLSWDGNLNKDGSYTVKITGKLMRDYGLSEHEKCAFCGNLETVRFNEHYAFCPECAAIYTSMDVEKGCEHIKEDALIVTHAPWFKDIREKIAHVVKIDNKDCCSICQKPVEIGGW